MSIATFKLGPLIRRSGGGHGHGGLKLGSDRDLIPGLSYGPACTNCRFAKWAEELFENAEIAPDIPVASDPTAWDKGEEIRSSTRRSRRY